MDILNSYFGYTIHNTRGKPTNSEFIAMISDKLRLHENSKLNQKKKKKAAFSHSKKEGRKGCFSIGCVKKAAMFFDFIRFENSSYIVPILLSFMGANNCEYGLNFLPKQLDFPRKFSRYPNRIETSIDFGKEESNMLNFTFYNPAKIYFGAGQEAKVGSTLLNTARKSCYITVEGRSKRMGFTKRSWILCGNLGSPLWSWAVRSLTRVCPWCVREFSYARSMG